MNLTKTIDGNNLTISIEGRLDTTTAPELEACLDESLKGIEHMVLDMQKLEYISSAGIRGVLKAQKIMNKQGDLVVKNVSDEVMEVFDITGFLAILTIV